jgi:acetylornithine deacetylase/succinyl-diaminopimelate desuccinylase-like protein
MPSLNKAALEFAHQEQNKTLDTLFEFLRFPSVSTDPNRKEDMVNTAEWLAHLLDQIGMTRSQLFPTNGHPIVYSEYKCENLDAPTVLIYGHYDVQPADPLELWQSDPFNPEIRGENLFGRGSSDMKGQVIATIKAVEAILKMGHAPVNIKFILEGEEEIGSPNLDPFLKGHKDLLACDIALNPDTGMIGADTPTITYALRGLAYFELRVYGPGHDLHSGLFGGIIHNPAQALAEIIAGLHSKDGSITLPNFYKRVRQLSKEERDELARLPMSDDYYLEQTGSPAIYGETGYTSVERIGARPTLDVNGLYAGFTGKGSKTVIPSWAMAKISMRLVPDQDPDEVYHQLIQYLNENAPQTIRWEVEKMAGSPASISDIHHPATLALAKAFEQVWGSRPLYKRDGGSVPVVGSMQSYLGVESVLTGFGLPDDNIHAPNEKLHLPTFYKGIDTLINFLYNYGEK